jgi:2-polyprenyl-3-methyl-5-hydroxy-6-metoxy-1,4-benzoquinol methylase
MTQENAALKDSIRNWWANNPMTYGAEHGRLEYVHPDGRHEFAEIGTARFFELADMVFAQWNEPHHDATGNFGRLFDYARYQGRSVLEVGCGMGCMAMNWARQGARLTAVDLNPTAVAQTRKRFELFGLEGDIRECDGERLCFPDASFDYVYSWGVLHHTPNTADAIEELRRVLRPGGRVGVMLYSRSSLLSRYIVGYLEGLVNMESRFLTPLGLGSRYGDGDRQEGNPHTWPVTKAEVRRDLFHRFEDVSIDVFGTDVPWILNHWLPNLAERMPKALVRELSRRFGWSLWIQARKGG